MNYIDSIFRLFFAPDAGTGVTDTLPELSDTDFLEQGDKKEEVVEDKEVVEDEEEIEEEDDIKDVKKEDEEDEEDDEEEVEEEEEEVEDEEEIVSDGRITVKGLKEQYPDIFKKNPSLKDVIFREREYSKRFGSIEDADEAYSKSEAFDNFENTLLSGGIGELIDAIADTDQNAAMQIAENFLPELYSRSKSTFAKVTMPVVKGVLRNTFTRANNQGNKQLALACQYISRDLFESSDVLAATEIESNEPDPRLEELNKKKQEIYSQQVGNARNDILNTVKTKLSKDIASRIPGNVSEFTRDALVEKITDELDSTLFKDKAHMAYLNSLWKKMSKAGFTSEAKSKIISASLGRARQVLPAVVAKIKAQGKNNGKKPVIPPQKQEMKSKRFPNQPNSKTRAGSPAKLGRNMSDFEFLSK